MYPDLASSSSAVWSADGFPSLPQHIPGAVLAGNMQTLRVTCRGGFYFDAPPEAEVQGASVASLRTGRPFFAPFSRPCRAASLVPFSFLAANNRGQTQQFDGVETVSDVAAELLGWIIEDGTVTSDRQSLRFSSSDVWSLTHVENLTSQAFPSVRVSYYAKNRGFDLTLTGGISNPLRMLIRKMRLVEGFPCAAFLFSKSTMAAFLRGLWGAHGWVCSRKGGNDVDLGLKRTDNEAYTSLLRELHVYFGLRGQRRNTPTKETPLLHRLVFSGYANYSKFFDSIGQIGEKDLQAPPVRRQVEPEEVVVDVHGCSWYKTRIQKIVSLGQREVWRLP